MTQDIRDTIEDTDHRAKIFGIDEDWLVETVLKDKSNQGLSGKVYDALELYYDLVLETN